MSMTHAYYTPIDVERSPDALGYDQKGQPASFVWRGERYSVLDVWREWHLMDRWWEDAEIPGMRKGRSDRFYYLVRAQVPEHKHDIICEMYWDDAAQAWVMARVYD